MTYVRVQGFKIFNDRHGKPRCYHRKSGLPVDLQKHPRGSAEFFAECQRIVALSEQATPEKPGTLGMLIAKYREHPAFTDLAPRTRADYLKVFDYLKPITDTELKRFDTPLVVRIRDRAAEKCGRRFGTYVKTVLSLLFAWGVERGHMKSNPAFKVKGVKRPKNAPRANRPWKDPELWAVLEAAPPYMLLPLSLMAFCGVDPENALKLPRHVVNGDTIDIRRAKTGEGGPRQIPAGLRDALAAAPRHDAPTLCANSRGTSWTVDGFNASWRKLKLRLAEAEKVGPDITLKGLRHTVANILSEMGHDERAIADVLGQKGIEMARHYSRGADKSRKLAALTTAFDAEMDIRRAKVVKPTAEDCQT